MVTNPGTYNITFWMKDTMQNIIRRLSASCLYDLEIKMMNKGINGNRIVTKDNISYKPIPVFSMIEQLGQTGFS